MRQYRVVLVALLLVVLLPAYAGSDYAVKDAEKHISRLKFSAQITFGDSLSDVGTYAVGTVAALGVDRKLTTTQLGHGTDSIGSNIAQAIAKRYLCTEL